MKTHGTCSTRKCGRLVYEHTREDAAKAIARQTGVSGRPGGWLYSEFGRPLCQGWSAYAKLWEARGAIKPRLIETEDGRVHKRWVIDWKRVR